MTPEEEALLTKLAEGPVAEADLDDAGKAVVASLVGRNVVCINPNADGSDTRQAELTHVGRMYVDNPQEPVETPPPEGQTPPPEGVTPPPEVTHHESPSEVTMVAVKRTS